MTVRQTTVLYLCLLMYANGTLNVKSCDDDNLQFLKTFLKCEKILTCEFSLPHEERHPCPNPLPNSGVHLEAGNITKIESTNDFKGQNNY